MRILVWGLGYVGTVNACCLAQLGHEVIGVDIDQNKVDLINDGQSPVGEPQLNNFLREEVSKGKLRATSNGISEVCISDISLICVGTPSLPNGYLDIENLKSVVKEIGKGLKKSEIYHVIVVRSTIFPGVTRNILVSLLEEYSNRTLNRDFGLVINPEFLRESTAICDFYSPPYVLIGEMDERAGKLVELMYEGINAPIYHLAPEEAEVIKIVSNSFHAIKIGFTNEVTRFCNSLELDASRIMQLVCADTKLNISSEYMSPGFAFGGSCLPKDLRVLVAKAKDLEIKLPILENVLFSNSLHIEEARLKIRKLGVLQVAVFGLSFKPNINDIRESPIIILIQKLFEDGISLLVYDPDVKLENLSEGDKEYLKSQLPQIDTIFRSRPEEVLSGCQAVIITKEKPEFYTALKVLGNDVFVLSLHK